MEWITLGFSLAVAVSLLVGYLVSQNKKQLATINRLLVESYEADKAWEQGRDELIDMYEGQILTMYEGHGKTVYELLGQIEELTAQLELKDV